MVRYSDHRLSGRYSLRVSNNGRPTTQTKPFPGCFARDAAAYSDPGHVYSRATTRNDPAAVPDSYRGGTALYAPENKANFKFSSS